MDYRLAYLRSHQVELDLPNVRPIQRLQGQRQASQATMNPPLQWPCRDVASDWQPPRFNRPSITAGVRRSYRTQEDNIMQQAVIDPSIPMSSVQHLIPSDLEPVKPSRRDPIPPIPHIFKQKSVELRKLRRDQVWRNGTRDEQVMQMDEWFPDVSNFPSQALDMRRLEKSFDADISRRRSVGGLVTSGNSHSGSGRPISNIGDWAKLPGELRNRIYRLAVVEVDSPVKVKMEPQTCGQGRCMHMKVSYNVPGVANTCRQMRWEVLPIFCAENVAFQFDDETVKECCVSNFLRSLGDYADHISEFQFILKRPIWNRDSFDAFTDYVFTLTTPYLSPDKCFELTQSEVGGREVCQCALEELVASLNERKDYEASGKLVREFADSEELSDFVWRMRKSKQWMQHLARCSTCKEVLFNN